jgi:hypothetical protein
LNYVDNQSYSDSAVTYDENRGFLCDAGFFAGPESRRVFAVMCGKGKKCLHVQGPDPSSRVSPNKLEPHLPTSSNNPPCIAAPRIQGLDSDSLFSARRPATITPFNLPLARFHVNVDPHCNLYDMENSTEYEDGE